MDEWTSEWPTEPGWYWFYGWRSSFSKRNSDRELIMVKARKLANGVAHIADGAFLFEGEGAEGVFCKAIVPPLPAAPPGEGERG